MATIVFTVAKAGADYTSLTAAEAALPADFSGNDYVIRFLDKATYDEGVTIGSFTNGTLVVEGRYDGAGRTRMTREGVAGYVIDVDSDNTTIRGIEFDREEPVDDNRSGILISIGASNCFIDQCNFLGNGFLPEFGIRFFGTNRDGRIENSLFYRWGQAAIRHNMNVSGNLDFVNNTFVANQESLDFQNGVRQCRGRVYVSCLVIKKTPRIL